MRQAHKEHECIEAAVFVVILLVVLFVLPLVYNPTP